MNQVPIGKLNQRFHFMIETTSLNVREGLERQYTEVFAMWGKLTPTSGLPYKIDDKFEPDVTDKIVVRFNDKIKQNMRVRHNDVYYKIVTIKTHYIDYDRYMELLVQQTNTEL